jgi:hypothetical protein
LPPDVLPRSKLILWHLSKFVSLRVLEDDLDDLDELPTETPVTTTSGEDSLSGELYKNEKNIIA